MSRTPDDDRSPGYVSILTVANGVTMLRFPLLVVVCWLLYQDSAVLLFTATGLISLLMLMDTLDGAVARWRRETSLLGGALDIATDRAVEIVLWVVYAHLDLVPVVVPLVIIIRGALVDSIRDLGAQRGISAHAMMRTRPGRWLVASPVMRTGYALVKITAFLALAMVLAFEAGGLAAGLMRRAAETATWLTVVLCLARGIPVVVEAPAFIRALEREARR